MSSRPADPRPAPVVTADSAGFWQAAAERRLVVQRCESCGELRHPPRPICPSCRSTDHRWTEARGTGTVYSYSVLHHPKHPAFEYPIVAALVELDEGVRILTNLVDVAPHELRIGLAVEVTFADAADGTAVPVFRPAGAS